MLKLKERSDGTDSVRETYWIGDYWPDNIPTSKGKKYSEQLLEGLETIEEILNKKK